ncbi:hypothetical protein HBH70_011760 [Parastagonospora nodorum]|nr:hypothetical protein HBH70_011760 [Parastagonospora nodorum]
MSAMHLSRLKADQHFFVYQNILSLIAFIISYRLFIDELNIQQSLLDRATVVLIIISVNKTQLLLILGDRSTPSTLLAKFIPTTKIRDPLLKTLENAAKSRILLACADRRTRQCYLTICAILANYEEQVLLTSIKKNCYCTYCTKHYNFNIHVSLATDTLHLLLKVTQESSTIVSLLFILKAPFALHFIHASHDEDTLAYIQGALERMNIFKKEFRVYQQTLEEEKNFNYSKALNSICTKANSEAHHITIVKQFYSMTNKKEIALLAANHATIVKQSQLSTTINIQDHTYSTRSIPGIQPYLTKLPLSEVAANIAISNFIHAAARSSSKRHNNPKHCNKEVLYLILTIINYTCYDKDRKHIAYIRAFSKVLLFNNNRQIDNTTRILSIPFKFYDLSTIICLVHLVPRDLPNLTTHTTISYYVNNYIN